MSVTAPKSQGLVPFLVGTFFSSVGNFTSFLAILAFMRIGGYTYLQIGAMVGGGRLLSTAINLAFGHLADRYPARKILVVTELFCGALSLALIWAWQHGPSYYPFFVTFYLGRVCWFQIQEASRSKISKLLSGASYASNARVVKLVNQATWGTMFFAAGLSWYFVKYSRLEWAIVFDGITFLLNGVILWRTDVRQPVQFEAKSIPIFAAMIEKFRTLYHYSFSAALLNLLLIIVCMGGNLFMLGLAGDDPSWIPIMMGSSGLAVYIAGYLDRFKALKEVHAGAWVTLGASVSILGIYAGMGWLTLAINLIRNTAYWMLYNRFNATIQTQTPANVMASVSSANTVQVIGVTAAGEFVVGALQPYVSFYTQCFARGALCLMIVVGLEVFRATSVRSQKSGEILPV